MRLDVLLACKVCMLERMNCVPMGDMRVVGCLFVVPFACVFSSSAVVLGGLFVMLRRFLVQFLQLFHDHSSVKYR